MTEHFDLERAAKLLRESGDRHERAVNRLEAAAARRLAIDLAAVILPIVAILCVALVNAKVNETRTQMFELRLLRIEDHMDGQDR